MSRTSEKLKGYNGANPFVEAQAKSFDEEKLVEEFYPIALYWSLFNNQHEILLGTRGSGKTALLRMLSYSAIRLSKHPEAIRLRKRFIGLYIPLHLEFMASLQGKNYPDEKRLEYFQFAFNCAAAVTLVKELRHLVTDCFSDLKSQRLAEGRLLSCLAALWFPTLQRNPSSLADIEFEINRQYVQTPFWPDGSISNPPIFSSPIFTPIIPALSESAKVLGFDVDSISWLACVDEAEFLTLTFTKCINGFMRSEKRPLVLKMATLPFRHLTKMTLTPGVSVEGNGNDFNYRMVDLPWNSNDFQSLTDHLCKTRLANAQIVSPDAALEHFLGKEGKDDWGDYFALEIPAAECTDESLIESIVAVLSKERRERYERVKHDPVASRQQYLMRFLLVYYTRRMMKEHTTGARSVGWFAGALVVRRVADGNPRRFIQIMNDFFEDARRVELRPKEQHRVIAKFSENAYTSVEGLPEDGPLLKFLVDRIGNLLKERVHGAEMIYSGYNFEIETQLSEIPAFRRTIELGIAYSIIFADEQSVKNGLSVQTEFRLAHFLAVKHWLPMGKGESFVLKARDTSGLSSSSRTPRTTPEASGVTDALQLQLVPISPNESDLASRPSS